MTRTAVGPFSLNTDEPLDAKITKFFEQARSRGKSDLFREVMSVYFDRSHTDESGVNERLDRIENLIRAGVTVTSDVSETGFDSRASKSNNDPLVAKAELALDKLAML